MANQTSFSLEELSLEKPLWQPPINKGPFVVTHYPRVRYPENVIVSFYDFENWSRALFNVETEGYRQYSFHIITQPNELEQQTLEGMKKAMLVEAKELDAMTLCYLAPVQKAMKPESKLLMIARNTFIFMMNYYSYNDYLLDSHLANLRKGALKNHGGETK